MSDTKPFRVGFIGCGSYNSSLADKAVISPKLEAVACCDLIFESAQAFAEKRGLKAYHSIEELLASDIDGVVIATPNNAHRENVLAAFAAGKHVFVDKPMANHMEDALAMIDMSEKTGLTLSVGHNGRRRPGHRVMKKMIEDGKIGIPVSVEANFSHCGGLHLTPQAWRWYESECPALPLTQLGVHFADTVQYLLGAVKEVSSFMCHVATPAPQNDNTVSILRFENGLLGYLGSNYATEAVYYVNVYGTKGNLYCDGGDNLRYRSAETHLDEHPEVFPVDDQIEELEEFAECAQTGKKPEVDGHAALMSVAVINAALKSHQEHRPVTTEEVISDGRAKLK